MTSSCCCCCWARADRPVVDTEQEGAAVIDVAISSDSDITGKRAREDGETPGAGGTAGPDTRGEAEASCHGDVHVRFVYGFFFFWSFVSKTSEKSNQPKCLQSLWVQR